MGRASISIAITSNFNSRGIDAAIKKAEQLAVSAVHYQGQFGKAAVDMGASMGQAAARIAQMGKAVADLGDRLTMGVTVPMGLAATAAVVEAAKIDTAWYSVRKTVDMTEEGYQRLKDGAMALSEVQPVSAETILNIEALGGQLGIANDYLEHFAKIVSGLDIATNLDSSTAATELAQMKNITQMTEDELENAASTIVDLGNHTATTEADIMQLALRFASAGHVAGMSNQDILGLSAALAGLGMKADAGGSALSQVINKISLDVAKGGSDVQKWADLVGEAPDKFAEAWRKAPTEQFVKVLKAISQDGADANEILNDLGITQIRQSDAMRRLASSGDLVTDSIQRANQAWSENSALTREVDNRNESLQARWDTLVNRFTNDLARIGKPIAEMGLDALNGLEPAIQGVGNLAQAFADADPSVQQLAFNLGAVAMAAGPVLSVAGRLMQAVGNMGQRVGRVTQQWGVYQEAMKTTDVSLLNTLANNQSMAASFGASRNAIVKAAGGLDRYNVAYRKTTDEIRRKIDKQTRATAYQEAYNEAVASGTKTEEECVLVAEKAAQSRETTAVVTKRQKEAIKDLNDSIDESNVKVKLNTDAVTDQEVALEKSSRTFGRFGDAVRGALAGFAGMAAMALVVAGVTAFATECERAARYSQDLTDATVGLNDAVSTSGIHLDAEAESVKGLAEAQGNAVARAEEAIQNQAKLGETIRQTDADANAQIGTLNRAWDTISSFANQSGLGASEQYRLKDAVDTVNEACGTQYSVIDASRGIIADENGVVQESTQAIYDNIEARKQQIKLEAQMKDLEGLYAQQAEDEAALRDLYSQNADAIDKYNDRREQMLDIEQRLSKLDPGTKRYRELSEQYSNLLRDVPDVVKRYWDLESALGTVNRDIDIANGKIDAQSAAVSNLGTSLQQWVDSNATFQEWFADAEGGVEGFAKAVEDAGLTKGMLQDIATNHREVLESLASEYDGTSESIVRALEKTSAGRAYLDQIEQGLGNLISRMREVPKFNEAFFGLDTTLDQFAEACERMGLNFESLNALSAEQLSQLASTFDGSVGSIIDGLGQLGDRGSAILENLGNNWRGSFDEATKGAIDAVVAMGDLTTAQLMALAHDFGIAGDDAVRSFCEALKAGMEPDVAASLAKDVSEQLGRALSPEEAAAAAKAYSDALAEGLGAEDAIQRAIDAIRQSLSQVNLTEEGQQARSTWLAGFNLGGGSGDFNIDPFKQNLSDHLDTVNNTVNEKGEVTGEEWPLSIADGANANAGVVEGAGSNIVELLLASLLPGILQASGVGSDTGQGYGDSVRAQGHVAEQAAINTLGLLLVIWLLGIESAKQAGTKTGLGFAENLAKSAQKAVAAAQAVSIATGTAFGAGRGLAESAGASLGNAFARAVANSGARAISNAQSIRNSVASIFSNIPTANVRVNVTRTVSTVPASLGGQTARYAALPSQVPVMPVPDMATARAQTVAELAVNRVANARSSGSGASAVSGAVSAVIRNQSAPIDYDTLFRVTEAAVASGIRKSGGLTPVVELDGKRVSRAIVNHLDVDFNRLREMRG